MLIPIPQLLFFFVISFVALRITKTLSTTRKEKKMVVVPPPGSCGWPLIGETLAFIRANNSCNGVYDFVQIRHMRYGKIFKTNILNQTHVFVASSATAKAILAGESTDFSKRYIRSIAELLGEHSLLCASSRDRHQHIRRVVSGLFSADTMSTVMEVFDGLVREAMGRWEEGGVVLVLDHAMKITFQAICKMLMSLDDENELEILQKDVFEVTEAMLSFPFKLPGTRFYKGLKARKRIMKVLDAKIALRRKGLEHHEDFLQKFIEMKDPLENSQILDNILTLIIAGQITTASAIAWMVKYLDENQDVQDKLREIQSKISSKFCDSFIGLEALSEMSYASKIVKESLRMATIVSWFPRVALNDCKIQGYDIKKGWIVNIDARFTHYDPELYDEPLKFNPSRFDEDPKPNSYLAFGIGGRTCLGMNLAKSMMIIFLHRLVTAYRWEVTDKDTSLEKWAMFPRLRSGCPIRVTRIIGHPDTTFYPLF